MPHTIAIQPSAPTSSKKCCRAVIDITPRSTTAIVIPVARGAEATPGVEGAAGEMIVISLPRTTHYGTSRMKRPGLVVASIMAPIMTLTVMTLTAVPTVLPLAFGTLPTF